MWEKNRAIYKTPMEKYSEEHPGCSLQEYCDYLRKIEESKLEEKKLEEERINNRLKSFSGKCCRVDFGKTSFGYFRAAENITGSFDARFYEVFTAKRNVIKIIVEEKRKVPRSWLLEQNGVTKCEIISEETFDKIVEWFQGVCNEAKGL